MDTDAYRDVFAEVVGFAAFPVLVVLGLVAAVAVGLTGRWGEGVLLGLEFWVAAGLLRLAVGTTWAAIGGAVLIIAIRRMVLWSITRARAAGARAASDIAGR